MHVLTTIAEVRAARRALEGSVGLVPTMGYLHDGHLSLVKAARVANDHVFASIFVNPAQFGPNEDLSTYPRDTERDLSLLESCGVDCVFMPEPSEVYPEGFQTYVEVGPVAQPLEGAIRPEHFRGVATVVLKLFNIVQPGRAYFGEKDAQQLAVIRRMVEDLNMPLTIVEAPTVREDDGLAISSRNVQLNAEQRRAATVLSQALFAAREQAARGEREAAALKRGGLSVLAQQPSVRVEYFEVVDGEEMLPVDRIEKPARIAGAVWVGKTRLIDNVLVDVDAGA